jgi:hypothetical protein
LTGLCADRLAGRGRRHYPAGWPAQGPLSSLPRRLRFAAP